MIRGLSFAFLACIGTCGIGQPLYKAFDVTAENLFTRNIEGPVVDSNGNLFVVNFQRDGTIGQVMPDGKVVLWMTLPDGSTGNSLQFDSHGNMLVADWTGHNILSINSKKIVSVFCHRGDFNQPNDIVFSKRNFVFASDPNWKEGAGKLWRIDAGGKATLLNGNMGTTNGIELSPDEQRLYVNESKQLKIWLFDLTREGNITNQTLLYQFEDFGLDGMKCDQAGNLYVTRHGKGTVAILSPEGKFLHEVQLKGKEPSNIVFGGPDGKTCFVTLQDRKCIEGFRSEFAGKKFLHLKK